MSNIYSKLFSEIFEESGRFLIHDFNEIKGQTDNNHSKYNFVISAYKKVFDVLMQHLEKIKYNGVVVLPQSINIGRSFAFTAQQVIENSSSIKKNISVPTKNKEGKIEYTKEKLIKIVEEDVNCISVKLSNAREEKEVLSKIIAIPIDGLTAFANGQADFSMVLTLQQASVDKKDDFETQQVMVYNPLTRDTYSFDKMDGFICNKNKIADRDIKPATNISSVFVDNYSKPFSFNLNKLYQISDVCLNSTSIFNSIGLLSSTTINLLVYHKNDNALLQNLIEFCIKTASFSTTMIGEHMLIGNDKILAKFKK